MANIRVNLDYTIFDGATVSFKAPVSCSDVTGIKIYYPSQTGAEESKEFKFADAHANDVSTLDDLFDTGAIVKVILDVTSGKAFVQNADTNAYLERKFADLMTPVNISADLIDFSKVPKGVTVDTVYASKVCGIVSCMIGITLDGSKLEESFSIPINEAYPCSIPFYTNAFTYEKVDLASKLVCAMSGSEIQIASVTGSFGNDTLILQFNYPCGELVEGWPQ